MRTPASHRDPAGTERQARWSANVLAILLAVSAAMADDAPTPQIAEPPTCVQRSEHRQFDFWLGDWEVRLADGRLAGTNRITREPGGCVLVERWKSSRGGSGISLNYFSPAGREWIQQWVGSDGSLINIRGGLEGQSMRLVGTIEYMTDGQTRAFRGTWTPLPDGRVRQHFEESADGGATWTDWFEGFYSRRDPASE